LNAIVVDTVFEGFMLVVFKEEEVELVVNGVDVSIDVEVVDVDVSVKVDDVEVVEVVEEVIGGIDDKVDDVDVVYDVDDDVDVVVEVTVEEAVVKIDDVSEVAEFGFRMDNNRKATPNNAAKCNIFT